MKNLLKCLILLLAIVTASLAIMTAAVLASDAPQIKHGTAGFENCLNCHGAGGLKPVPADHSGYPQAACLGCHSYATAATPAAMATTPAATGTAPAKGSNGACLACHSQAGLSTTLANGDKLALTVDQSAFDHSVHGNKLNCTDCHNTITGFPHPALNVTSAREYGVSQYEVCKKCHFENYTKSMDSVHYKAFAQGNMNAPICTDCHGVHNISLPDQPKSRISTTCSKCHADIYNQYADSVHGKALIQDNNSDAPVCTDCHPSHTIQDPTTASFRIDSVQLCSNCHGNAKLMQKYGISTNVVQSYLQDFHGSTVALIGQQNKDIWPNTAVCTDCHGVHDIKAVTDANSSVIKANLVTTCQKCHPDATPNFPGAWLSHYQPSPKQAPLVFLVQWFYKLMIPFILIGLGAHILLDLWRAITNR